MTEAEYDEEDRAHFARIEALQSPERPKAAGLDPATLKAQIEWANQRGMRCDEDGDRAGEEAWHGYVRALRWVEARMGWRDA